MKQILGEIKDLKSGQQRLEEEVSAIKGEVSTIKQEMGTKTQQRENTDMIKALLHNQEEFNAQLETLTLNTVSKAMLDNFATKEDTNRLEAKFDDLNVRLFNQTAEITQLKAVK